MNVFGNNFIAIQVQMLLLNWCPIWRKYQYINFITTKLGSFYGGGF